MVGVFFGGRQAGWWGCQACTQEGGMALREAEEPFPPHLCCRAASLHCLIPLPSRGRRYRCHPHLRNHGLTPRAQRPKSHPSSSYPLPGAGGERYRSAFAHRGDKQGLSRCRSLLSAAHRHYKQRARGESGESCFLKLLPVPAFILAEAFFWDSCNKG